MVLQHAETNIGISWLVTYLVDMSIVYTVVVLVVAAAVVLVV
jgi:hypothetical protein